MPPTPLFRLTVLLTMVALFAAGCAGAATPTAVPPTIAPLPTYAFVQPTEAPAVATAGATRVADVAATAEAVALDPELVERGRGRYEALECATCHGDNGEGTADGSSLIESTQTEEEFVSFMRSGGDLGPDHQYSTNRLSDSGGRNLYQYLLSLRGG